MKLIFQNRWTQRLSRRSRLIVGALLVIMNQQGLLANPEGLTIRSGTVTVQQSGNQMTLEVSHNATLDWKSFNIKAGETTTFQQPSSRSVVWNRIWDQNPSQIWGNLNANGYVVLMNQSGFYFGPNSVIKVGGFLATTAPVTPPGVAPGPWQFTGQPPVASIINYGQIQTASGGSLFLVAEKIENHGVLMAPDGTLGLYAGKEVLVSDSPDGRGLSANVKLPIGSIDNTGKLIADAGTIAMHAQVVNQGGLIQANGVRERNGIIELIATDRIELGANSLIQANGDVNGTSPGGAITIKSVDTFLDNVGSRLEIHGGGLGGDAGKAEISAPHMTSIKTKIDGWAAEGSKAGRLLIDPDDIVLGNASNVPDGALQMDPSADFTGLGEVVLQANHSITLGSSLDWNLNQTTGISAPGSLLRLEAGNDIIFEDNSRLVAGQGWSVQMAAGADFLAPLSVPADAASGSIYFNGGPADSDGNRPEAGGSLEARNGNITLVAAKDVYVGSGFVRTVGGGNIDITARSGSVDAGSKSDWYTFSRNGYVVSNRGLGGIATAAGGNLSINAGGDINSTLPTCGALGAAPGDVALKAGGNITGKFLVRNGTGTLEADGDVGSGGSGVSLGLVKGTWNATANNIFVNEVFNPNGTFNDKIMSSGAKTSFQFDYDAAAAVNLKAVTGINLMGNALPRGGANADMLAIYAPILSLEAGSGGITLGNDLILYPSAKGALNVKTTSDGSFRSAGGNSFQLVMSDSDSPKYVDFVDGHAATPLHLAYAGTPVRADIDGDIQDVRLQLPKRSLINVGGDTLNFFYKTQNLLPTDISELRVEGDIKNRSDLTTATFASDPNLVIFDNLFLARLDLGLEKQVSYDPATKELTFHGRMTAAQRDFLLNPMVKQYDPIGNELIDAARASGKILTTAELSIYLITDSAGNPVLVPTTFADAARINALYDGSQDVPLFSTKSGGVAFGGLGKAIITARNMDLGITLGLRSIISAVNPSLAIPATPGAEVKGADLEITLGYLDGDRSTPPIPGAGNLDIISSQIASFNGGAIDLMAAGRLNVGSQKAFTTDDTPKGIYTGHGGAVKVLAEGDININGSRIGSYDGGDVSVVSKGNIDAGVGGRGFFLMSYDRYMPDTGQVELNNDRFFGSGIVALNSINSAKPAGNLLVKAGGDILANSGGVLQMSFNASDSSASQITLEAGRNIQAANSGVMGINVKLDAKGDIQGFVVANNNVEINASRNVNVSALGGGNVNVKAGQTVSGSIVGAGNVDVAGSAISASVVSTGGSTKADGATSVGAFASVAAPVASRVTTSDQEKPAVVAKSNEDEDPEKKKKKAVQLTRTVGRVTVILPKQ